MRISDWSSDVCSSDLLLRGEQFAPFPGADKVHRMMPERMNAVAVAVAVRHAIAGDLDPKRTLDVLHERMGGKQRMAKADLARLVLLCADDLDGELKQARQIGRASSRERVCQYV